MRVRVSLAPPDLGVTMKFFFKAKDGGPESTVTGYWLFESKRFLSICLLKFDGRSRECFHTHAFDSIAWVLKGKLIEHFLFNKTVIHLPSIKPFIVRREDFHKVDSDNITWVLNIRGPWVDTWKEFLPSLNKFQVLTHGRHIQQVA